MRKVFQNQVFRYFPFSLKQYSTINVGEHLSTDEHSLEDKNAKSPDVFVKRLMHEIYVAQDKKEKETKKLILELEEHILNIARSGEFGACVDYYDSDVEEHFRSKGLNVKTESGRNETYMTISWNHLSISNKH